jgi:site-specific DNA-methyltransferase (adenine-specific)
VKPYYQDSAVTIYHGDCREIAPVLGLDYAVVSDPPYGMRWDGRVTPGPGGHAGGRSYSFGVQITGDDKPFDPTPWREYPEAILWGANHYWSRLPQGTTLVWIKRNDNAFGSFLSDAEIAWQRGGCGVYCHRGVGYKSEDRNHPTQKPLGLMAWCVERTRGVILDPFMGSGTTLRAAKNLGRKAIGIEIEERYCEIAARRMGQEVMAFS